MTDRPITEEAIARLVPAFYARVREDEVLGPIFNGAVEDWPHHLEVRAVLANELHPASPSSASAQTNPREVTL